MNTLKAIIRPLTRGDFWAEMPALPGCVATGPSRDQALENLYEVVGYAVDAYRAAGRTVPWQEAEVPSDGEVVSIHPFWDEPLQPVSPERIKEIEAEYARGEFIDIADVLREYGVDVPER
jgi:predicted RNase H-like HicB family nuclease